MIFADDPRIENARIAGQRIDRRINAALDDLAAEVYSWWHQVRERRGRRRVGVIVGGHVNRLHRSDRTVLGGSDALLQLADLGVQVRLVSHGGRHSAKQRGRLAEARLHEPENVVDEKLKRPGLLHRGNIPRRSRRGQSHASGARRSGSVHLAVNQRRARFFRIAGNHDARFLHLEPKVVSFARALAHSREHRHAAMLHRDVMDQLFESELFCQRPHRQSRPILPPLRYGSNRSTTLMPVSNISRFRRLIHERRRRAESG